MASVAAQEIALACFQGPSNYLCHYLPWPGVAGLCCRKKDLKPSQFSPSLPAFPLSVFCTILLSAHSVCPHDSLSAPCLSVCQPTCSLLCLCPFPKYSVLFPPPIIPFCTTSLLQGPPKILSRHILFHKS